MPVPGIAPELDLRAKVRVGDKGPNGYPRALDHFVSDDADFTRLAGEKPKVLRIRFPYAEAGRCFPTGMELWKKASTPILACYTKGDGIAHRLGKTREANGDIKLDPTKGSKRGEMTCRGFECPYASGQKPDCRPQGRLSFFIVGDTRVDSVWKLETKSLNTIQQIEGVLQQYADLRGITFELRAEKRKQREKEFTVVTIHAVGEPAEPAEPVEPAAPSPKQALKDYLVATDRWPMTDEQIEWVKSVGPEAALARLQKAEA